MASTIDYDKICVGETPASVREEKDGTLTVYSWIIEEHEIPGFTDRKLANAVARVIEFAFNKGVEQGQTDF